MALTERVILGRGVGDAAGALRSGEDEQEQSKANTAKRVRNRDRRFTASTTFQGGGMERMRENEIEEAEAQAKAFREALEKGAAEMDAEEARQNAAFLMRSLELIAMGADKIQVIRQGQAVDSEALKLWARVDAISLRKIFQANGLSTVLQLDQG